MQNEAGVYDGDWFGFDWSPWRSLHPDSDGLSPVPTDPGVYRVRHDAYEGLVYIGETGRSLSGRLHALRRNIYNGEMPYSSPHTGSPSFWAIVDRHDLGFEVSVASPDGIADKYQRKAIEDALIAVHRRETESNLVGNFGRMPPGYEKSKVRSTGDRGGLSDDPTTRSFREGISPLPWTNRAAVTAHDWMGLSWSAPAPLSDVAAGVPSDPGVYRIWDPEAVPPLEYIGEGFDVESRLQNHARNRDSSFHFAYARLPEFTEKFQLAQAETSLLGAHWLACGEPPRDQY